MSNFFETARQAVAMVPMVADTVKTVEGLLPASPGKEKLDAAITMIQALVGIAADFLPTLEKLIGAIVVILKLNKTAQAAAAVPAPTA